MTDELRIGVIGTGGMGARHAENIARHVVGATISGVADPDTHRAAHVAEAVGATVYPSGDELIASDSIDAVVIASPDDTHAHLAIACIEHSKPVLVEKPLATRVEDALAVVRRQADEPSSLVQVGFMRRYDPGHLAVAVELADDIVGPPKLFRGWHRNPASAVAPSSEDVLVQSAVHDFDSARWLMGQEIEEVFVRGVKLHGNDSAGFELQLISMRFDRGAIGVIEINRDSGCGYEVGVEVTGSQGVAATPPHHTATVRTVDRLQQRIEHDWLQRFADAYVGEVKAWVAGIHTQTMCGAGVWDGYVASATALAGVRSLETQQSVRLTLPDRPTAA